MSRRVGLKRRFDDVATTSFVFRGGKRPVTKSMVTIAKNTVSAQVSTALFTATFPCTAQGFRIDMEVTQDAGANPGSFGWAIVLVREGNSAKTMVITDAGAFYAPEENVVMFGSGIGGGGADTAISTFRQLNTKTMRKMKGGDQLHFLAIGEATNTSAFQGVIQFFCKT